GTRSGGSYSPPTQDCQTWRGAPDRHGGARSRHRAVLESADDRRMRAGLHGRPRVLPPAARAGAHWIRCGWRTGPVPRLARRLVHRARFAGLLAAGGREVGGGRIGVPELRHDKPVWLVGRLLEPTADVPRYLGLSGAHT